MDEAGSEAWNEPLGLELAPGTEVAGFTLEDKLAGRLGHGVPGAPGGPALRPQDGAAHARGEREVDALRRVRDTHVVGFHGYGFWPHEQPRFLVLALELVRGWTLDAWAREVQPLARASWCAGAAAGGPALAGVHALGVVHRDVKEANVVMREEDGQPVLVDFGAATYAGRPAAHRAVAAGDARVPQPRGAALRPRVGREPLPGGALG